jgi:polysaccharide pyruvyl transferase WcaK-like protein
MTRAEARPMRRGGTVPRVGFFGLLGSGNLGNDGSLRVMLDFLRDRHPDAKIDFMCMGPEEITKRLGYPARALHWYYARPRAGGRLITMLLKSLGKVVDAVRIFLWVRELDVVIVPGMGVLEAALPLRAWGFPYLMFLMCAAGRLSGARVALVSVGATVMRQRMTRRLFAAAARRARYRSYRDGQSRDAMRAMGVDTTPDRIYPDLVYALPGPAEDVGQAGVVGVGVMAYHGGNDDRAHAEEIHADYLAKMTRFVVWLLDRGRTVRVFIGDLVDQPASDAIIAAVHAQRPGTPAGALTAVRLSSLDDLLREMAAVESVVATRYHNVLCALKLLKPTVSLGYATKNDVLMRDMGLGEYCQPVRSFDVELLIEQFTEVESRRAVLRESMRARNERNVAELTEQFDILSAELMPAGASPTGTALVPDTAEQR